MSWPALMTILGGLALFLFGMSVMTQGLREWAGGEIRRILSATTRGPVRGYALGTGLGFTMHSSAASVMTLGFVNAGMLPLLAALPILYGLNLGTTLSMQLLSFRLTDLAYVFLFFGFALQLVLRRGGGHHGGRALLGFGMLFLGMKTMGEVLGAFRGDIAPWLARIDGSTWPGLFTGILVALIVTGILQSSGAVIGMAFVMLDSGALTSLAQAYPIILGAHIGTSVTGLLGSIGTNVEARRTAIANLSFNLFNVFIGVLAAPFFIAMIERTSADPVHQAANAHTALMLVAGLLLLPFTRTHERLVRACTPSREAVPTGSFLDPDLLHQPENALCAVISELNRALAVCRKSLQDLSALQVFENKAAMKRILMREEVLNEIKAATRAYLTGMTDRYLSRRQALMVQYLSRANINIERIGDHIEALSQLNRQRWRENETVLVSGDAEALQELIQLASGILDELGRVFSADKETFEEGASRVLALRDAWRVSSSRAISQYNQLVELHQRDALAGLYFTEIILGLSRMVRHCRLIAQQVEEPFFFIKKKKIDRKSPRKTNTDSEEVFILEPLENDEEEYKKAGMPLPAN